MRLSLARATEDAASVTAMLTGSHFLC